MGWLTLDDWVFMEDYDQLTTLALATGKDNVVLKPEPVHAL